MPQTAHHTQSAASRRTAHGRQSWSAHGAAGCHHRPGPWAAAPSAGCGAVPRRVWRSPVGRHRQCHSSRPRRAQRRRARAGRTGAGWRWAEPFGSEARRARAVRCGRCARDPRRAPRREWRRARRSRRTGSPGRDGTADDEPRCVLRGPPCGRGQHARRVREAASGDDVGRGGRCVVCHVASRLGVARPKAESAVPSKKHTTAGR